MILPNYQIGEKVFVKGEEEKLTIKDIQTNRLGVRMFAFEETGDCYMGEIHVKRNAFDKFPSMTDVLDSENILETEINSTSMGLHSTPYHEEEIAEKFKLRFFEPDYNFCLSLKEYLNERLLVHIGSGNGHLLRYMTAHGCKVMGIEPNYDQTRAMQASLIHDNLDRMLHILPREIADCKAILKGIGNRALYVIATPYSVDFLEDTIETIPIGSELLYISLKENVDAGDLNGYNFEKIDLNGTSKYKEVIYKFVKR